MEYEETDFTPPATNVHKVVRAKSKKKKKVQNEETSVISEVVSGLYSDIAQSAMDKLKSKDFGKEGDTDKDKKLSQEEERAQRNPKKSLRGKAFGDTLENHQRRKQKFCTYYYNSLNGRSRSFGK